MALNFCSVVRLLLLPLLSKADSLSDAFLVLLKHGLLVFFTEVGVAVVICCSPSYTYSHFVVFYRIVCPDCNT